MRRLVFKEFKYPDLKSSYTSQRKFQVFLGNNLIAGFDSLAEAKRFLGQSGMFYTDKLMELNGLLTDTYTRFRQIWPLMVVKNRKSTKKFEYQQTLDKIHLVEKDLEYISNPNNSYKTQMYGVARLIKAAELLEQAATEVHDLYYEKSMYVHLPAQRTTIRLIHEIYEQMATYGYERQLKIAQAQSAPSIQDLPLPSRLTPNT